MKTIFKLLLLITLVFSFNASAGFFPGGIELEFGAASSMPTKTETRDFTTLKMLKCVNDTAGNECTPREMTTTSGGAISAGYAPSGVAFKIIAIVAHVTGAGSTGVVVSYSDTDCGFEDTACAVASQVIFGGASGGSTGNFGAVGGGEKTTLVFQEDTAVIPDGKFIALALGSSTTTHFTVWGFEE